MNQELYKQAEALYERLGKLNKTIAHCNTLLREIAEGAEFIVMGRNYNLNISECNLDDAQTQLLEQLMTGILKNRMEEAEKELKSLLPAEDGYPVPACAPRRRRKCDV